MKKLEFSDEQFNDLADRVLMKLLDKIEAERGGFLWNSDAPESITRRAVEITAEFEWALRQHYRAKYSVDGLTPEEVDLLHEGEIIKCVKSLRERSNMKLKEAKNYVDKFRREMGLM